jgi:signal transduction histidine kinase
MRRSERSMTVETFSNLTGGIPPISAAPVFVRSGEDDLTLVPGSVVQAPEECLRCPSRECTRGAATEGFLSCPWGFEFIRLTDQMTVFGIVARQAMATESAATRKRRRLHSRRGQALDRRVVEGAANALKQYVDNGLAEHDRQANKERRRRLSAITPSEVVAELREQFDQFVALNHDYVKIAAGIRANLDRLKRDIPQLNQRGETQAIEGAARRLEDLPSLHRILVDPSVVHTWPDRTRHRLFATLTSYYYVLRPIAEERGVVLHYPSAAPSSPSDATIYASRRVLGGVFLQLMDNAITYSQPGESVSVVIEDSPNSDSVTVAVSSVGPRIEPDEHELIFLPFYRGRAAQASRDGGGVGLAIVAVAVKELGGTVTVSQDEVVESRGKTTFWVRLPKS